MDADNVFYLKAELPASLLQILNPELSFKFDVIDNGDPPLESNLFLNISISDENPILPPITLDTMKASETIQVGNVVGTFQFQDRMRYTYSLELLKDSGGIFSISGDALILDKELDYSEAPSHEAVVQVTASSIIDEGVENITKVLTFTILVVPASNCSENENVCDINARCTVDKNVVTCQCKRGYTGDGYVCENNNDCLVTSSGQESPVRNPCMNGGVCIDEIGHYICECTTGYIGARYVPCCIFQIILIYKDVDAYYIVMYAPGYELNAHGYSIIVIVNIKFFSLTIHKEVVQMVLCYI